MDIIMNNEQKKSLAKFFYDIARLTFGAAVLGAALKGEASAFVGLFFTAANVIIGYNIEKEVGE